MSQQLPVQTVQCTTEKPQRVPRVWCKSAAGGGLDRVLRGVLDSETFVNAEGWRSDALEVV